MVLGFYYTQRHSTNCLGLNRNELYASMIYHKQRFHHLFCKSLDYMRDLTSRCFYRNKEESVHIGLAFQIGFLSVRSPQDYSLHTSRHNGYPYPCNWLLLLHQAPYRYYTQQKKLAIQKQSSQKRRLLQPSFVTLLASIHIRTE